MNKQELLNIIKNNESEFKGEKHNIKHLFLPNENSDYLIVVFSGFHGGEVAKKPPVYNYINTLKDVNINKLFIMDNVDNTPVYYYGTEGTDSYLKDTTHLVNHYAEKLGIKKSNIITTGSSKGGTGSLIVGLDIGVGHIISAANQLNVGTYLNSLPKVRELIFNMIFGSNDDSYVELLDQKFREKILVNSTESNLYFHAGTRDSHYIKHMKPMLENFDSKKIYYELDLKNYVGHNSVIYYYPEYLKRKINEILNLPKIQKPDVSKDEKEIIIDVNVSKYRKATHYYQVELDLVNGNRLVSEFKKDLKHLFTVEAKEIRSVSIILKEYEIIRDARNFNFDEINSKLDILRLKNLIRNEWITNKGEKISNTNMVRTKKLPYTSLNDYIVTGSVSVSYYSGDDFIKSTRVTGRVSELPFYIEKVSEADSIVLSFNKKWLGKMKLTTL